MRTEQDIVIDLVKGLEVNWRNESLINLVNLSRIFRERNGDKSQIREIELAAIEKYEAISFEDRRYCLGDMDSKDGEILEIIRKRQIEDKIVL